jgi:hypothetical protein
MHENFNHEKDNKNKNKNKILSMHCRPISMHVFTSNRKFALIGDGSDRKHLLYYMSFLTFLLCILLTNWLAGSVGSDEINWSCLLACFVYFILHSSS